MRHDKQTRFRVTRTAATAALGVIVVFGGAGCDKVGSRSPSAVSDAAGQSEPACKTDVAEWTEGVKLFNGQEVTVWRRAVACKGGFPVSKRGRDLEFELKYEPLGAHWKGPSGLKPKSLEIIDGVPHLTLYVMTGGYCRGKPSSTPLARVMKWVDGKWVELPPSDFPFNRALLNLHTNYWGYNANNDAKGFIPADGKVTGYDAEMTLRQFFALEVNQCILHHEHERHEPFAAPQPASNTNR